MQKEQVNIKVSIVSELIISLEKALASESHLMPTTVDDTQLLRRVPELFTKEEEMSRAVEKLMSSSADQELRIQLLEQATHNGIMVWRIDGVARRIDEAIKGITTSLFSAPFYSDPRGYKMCARYLYVDISLV